MVSIELLYSLISELKDCEFNMKFFGQKKSFDSVVSVHQAVQKN